MIKDIMDSVNISLPVNLDDLLLVRCIKNLIDPDKEYKFVSYLKNPILVNGFTSYVWSGFNEIEIHSVTEDNYDGNISGSEIIARIDESLKLL